MIILTPAYGRDYKSKKAVLDDWNSDKDFILNDMSSRWDGKPINKPQLTEEPSIQFRYSGNRKTFIHKQ